MTIPGTVFLLDEREKQILMLLELRHVCVGFVFVFLNDVSFSSFVSVGKRCGFRTIGKALIRVRPSLLWFITMSHIREDFGIICKRFFSRGPGNTDPSLGLKIALKVVTENSYFSPDICLQIEETLADCFSGAWSEWSSAVISAVEMLATESCIWISALWCEAPPDMQEEQKRNFAFGIASLWLPWFQRNVFQTLLKCPKLFQELFLYSKHLLFYILPHALLIKLYFYLILTNSFSSEYILKKTYVCGEQLCLMKLQQ